MKTMIDPRQDDVPPPEPASAEAMFPAPPALQRPPCGTQSGDALGVGKYEGGGLGRKPAGSGGPGNPFGGHRAT